MRIITKLSLLLLVAAAPTIAQNPIAEYYGQSEGYPAWTETIQWDQRIDMSQFEDGENDFEKFENARDLLFKKRRRSALLPCRDL